MHQYPNLSESVACFHHSEYFPLALLLLYITASTLKLTEDLVPQPRFSRWGIRRYVPPRTKYLERNSSI